MATSTVGTIEQRGRRARASPPDSTASRSFPMHRRMAVVVGIANVLRPLRHLPRRRARRRAGGGVGPEHERQGAGDRLRLRRDVLRRDHVRRARRPVRPAADVPDQPARSTRASRCSPRSRPSLGWLAVLRFFAGLGLGAELTLADTYLSELLPAQRARALHRLRRTRSASSASRWPRSSAAKFVADDAPADRRLALAAGHRRARRRDRVDAAAQPARSRRAGTRSAADHDEAEARHARDRGGGAARAGARPSCPSPRASTPRRAPAPAARDLLAAATGAARRCCASSRSCRPSATTASARWRRSCWPSKGFDDRRDARLHAR